MIDFNLFSFPPEYWQWLTLAAFFITIELLVPGAFILWFGIGSLSVGLLMLIFPGMSWGIQFVLFSAISIISIILWRSYQQKHPREADTPNLNKRGQQYVGRYAILEEPILGGRGRIKLGDSHWTVEGDDMDKGTKIIVTEADGTILKVKKAD